MKLATFSFSSIKKSSIRCGYDSGDEGKLRLQGAACKDYSRLGVGVSLGRPSDIWMRSIFAAFAVAAGISTASFAQYPGKITKPVKPDSVLRSIAVLEWTGDVGKPSASRLVPVTVFDGEQLNDGTIYLNRPEPLALQNGVEYELQQAGKPMGLFDVFAAGEAQGAWRGFGAWKPYSEAKIKADKSFNQSDLYAPVDVKDDDHPVLKRKHPKGTDTDDPIAKGTTKPTGSAGADAGASASSKGSTPAADDDPDRPKLKRKASAEDTGNTTAASSGDAGSSGTSSAKSAPDADPDRPVLKRKSDDSASSAGSGAGTAAQDPDRPTIRRSRKNLAEAGMMETATGTPDPDRPRLKRGKPADLGAAEAPRLMGTPASMEQVVAVSDASNRAEHPWKYTWANPDDEEKMKASLEETARTALGLNAPVAAPAKTVHKTTAIRKKPAPAAPVVPAALEDEKFRVFELAYGSSATMVLTASGPVTTFKDKDGVVEQAPQKFVTLIAQPDLYGGVLVLFKSVTDSAHLDETPRMRLVDAVDAMGDNRGELLFELRGSGQRQFALYRVLRGSAEQLFATVAIP